MLKNILLIGVLFYGFIVLFAHLVANRSIFLPPRSTYKDNPSIIKLTTKDGATISAIYLANPEAKYTILYSHGNAEDLGFLLPVLMNFRDHGYAVFAYDYHGYGLSSGKPTEKHAYNDIDAAYQYLTEKIKIPANKIIAVGTSIGAAVSINLAAKKPLGALVVVAPFVSAFRVVTQVPIIPFDKFNNLHKLKKVRCPIIVMHGMADRIVPFWHGEKIYSIAPQPKSHLWVEGAGHNDFYSIAGERFWNALSDITTAQ